MQLSAVDIERFQREGFLILPGLFSPAEVGRLKARLPALFAERCPENYREKLSDDVRSAFALHRRDPLFASIAAHPRLLGPARQILGEDFYLQQAKVNVKAPFTGEAFQWHYDFATHHRGDGVPEPLALNLHVFLDDVNQFNGPLIFIPGSQRQGEAPVSLDDKTTSYPLWTVDNAAVARLVDAGGMVASTGPAGTALIFGDLMVHCSPPNCSPWPRCIYSSIVNPLSNAFTSHARQPFQHERDMTPLRPLSDDCLLAAA
ncbi:MAG: proline hydroxylase [Alphaproteobacteria bacterium]|nr:proline hydroxylase [Alphaproteobacteria bacterium]